MEKEESLPEQFDFKGFLDWLNGMSEYASGSLPITSSGSYWTALWDCDYVAESAYDSGISKDAVDEWIHEMDTHCRAGWQNRYYLIGKKVA